MFVPSSAVIAPYPASRRQVTQPLVRLGMIIVAHMAILFGLKTGLHSESSRPALEAPKEIVASFINTENAPQQRQQVRQKPQVMMELEPAPTRVEPLPLPVPQQAPSEKAVSVPTPAAQPSAQAEPAAAAPVTSTAPAQPALTAQPKTLTSNVEYMQAPQPEYPALSRQLREQGTVVFRVLVNEKGRAERAEVQKSSGYARLDEAGRKALMRALFKPYSEDGRAMPVYVIAPISFN